MDSLQSSFKAAPPRALDKHTVVDRPKHNAIAISNVKGASDPNRKSNRQTVSIPGNLRLGVHVYTMVYTLRLPVKSAHYRDAEIAATPPSAIATPIHWMRTSRSCSKIAASATVAAG